MHNAYTYNFLTVHENDSLIFWNLLGYKFKIINSFICCLVSKKGEWHRFTV